MKNTKEMGARLRLLRGDRSQDEIAKAIGTSKQAVSCYERGTRVPSDEVKMRLSALYGISVQQLFFNTEVN